MNQYFRLENLYNAITEIIYKSNGFEINLNIYYTV